LNQDWDAHASNVHAGKRLVLSAQNLLAEPGGTRHRVD